MPDLTVEPQFPHCSESWTLMRCLGIFRGDPVLGDFFKDVEDIELDEERAARGDFRFPALWAAVAWTKEKRLPGQAAELEFAIRCYLLTEAKATGTRQALRFRVLAYMKRAIRAANPNAPGQLSGDGFCVTLTGFDRVDNGSLRGGTGGAVTSADLIFTTKIDEITGESIYGR